MPGLTLRALLSPRSGSLPALMALLEATGNNVCVVDTSDKTLLGLISNETPTDHARVPIQFEETTMGYVIGPPTPANAVALLLTHLAARESEGRALASEILHLYREVHLIEQLSEQLAALLNLSAVGRSSLAQAQRLIPATQGGILVMEDVDRPPVQRCIVRQLLQRRRRRERPNSARLTLCRLDSRTGHRRDRQQLRLRPTRPRLRAQPRSLDLCSTSRRAAHSWHHRPHQLRRRSILLRRRSKTPEHHRPPDRGRNRQLDPLRRDGRRRPRPAPPSPPNFTPPAPSNSYSCKAPHAPRPASTSNPSTCPPAKSVATSSSSPPHPTAPSSPS